MIEVALMFCFPIVEDLKGFIRVGHSYVTVSQELTHGSILHALKIGGVPSDSYICSDTLLEDDSFGKPLKAGGKGWFWELYQDKK